jgi:hypothetical protein
MAPPLPRHGWPLPFRGNDAQWGVDGDALCPCGSGMRAQRCHSNKTGYWQMAVEPPLLDDERTGFAHPKCYAAPSADCVEKLTKEHWLSAGIVKSAGGGKPVIVSGMPWQEGAAHTLGAGALGANVLCERHNSALSPLDETANQIFTVLKHFQADLREHPEPHGHEYAVFHGDVLERWMLKLIWGATAAKSLGTRGKPATGLRADIDLTVLADILFRSAPLPPKWGLYAAGRPGMQVSAEADFGMTVLTGPEDDVYAGEVTFGVVALRFAFGVPDLREGVLMTHHPSGVLISDTKVTAQKVLALAWDDGGGLPLILTRLADGTSAERPGAT